MIAFLRHVSAILLMPFVMIVVIPQWLLRAYAPYDHRWSDDSSASVLIQSSGIMIGSLGVILFIWCVLLFARVGQGTLAPWDPAKKLVAIGPYRHVRNPMISSVAMMVTGQAVYYGSWAIAIFAMLFLLTNHAYFVLSEEPGLEDRFGDNYREYKKQVPRWIPRIHPYKA
jgi:protein-S-isoprenylcysteine O-methyltransferase Ste14